MLAVDKAITFIVDSGLNYEVGPFGTAVEGSEKEVIALLQKLLASHISTEYLINVQFHVGEDKLSNRDKVAKFR